VSGVKCLAHANLTHNPTVIKYIGLYTPDNLFISNCCIYITPRCDLSWLAWSHWWGLGCSCTPRLMAADESRDPDEDGTQSYI